MGAEPWEYFVPYQDDIDAVLQALREQEFAAGRFRGSELNPATIEEAFAAMEECGTASILDIAHVSDTADFCAVAPLPDEELVELFGTTEPTRETIQHDMSFFEDIERGQGVYIIVYNDGQPSEIFFGGYSFD